MNVNTTVGNKKANQISECLCCNVKLNHPGAIKEHFSSKKHMNKWIRYVQENEIQLTSEFSLEESGQVNDKNIVPPINQYMQGVSSGNTGTNVVQYANAGPNFITDFAKLLDTKTSGSPKQAQLPDNAGQNKPNLRAQIFTELEKLVQTLYYSKKLPDQVSLDYIKKINQEVEILIEKHQKSNYVQTNTINKSETKTVKSPVTGSGDKNKITTNEVKPQVQAKSASEIKPQENVLKKPETSKQDTPFSSLLTEIVDEKHRLQKAGHRNDAKKLDVLSEIEILLLQISKPELPHQEILDCLKTFNGIIDLDCKKKQSCQPCNGM